ncbi:type I restriction endonuclease subunit R [Chroococcidiopsidales cyanobacterium LEGE 13417]|nr:type I restriction endonuclease subunit R [Chroococcidiopsis sp. CCALA 051]MBE9014591.1 type I restriction endonuclease subunit R [Chroococcidiopsidales cyanobacterium LEGE 13417]
MKESDVEVAVLAWFKELEYTTLHGREIAPEQPNAERQSFADIVLEDRLRSQLTQINPKIPFDAIEAALRKVVNIGLESPSRFENNRRFHKLLSDGIDVEYQAQGRVIYDKVWLIDFDNIENNDWLVVNQFTIIENNRDRRPDVVIFINGLPLAVIELKNPAEENATIKGAFNQLQTYKQDIPSLFPYNEVLVISDGLTARVGTLTADWERFMPWRTIAGNEIATKNTPELEVLIKGIFAKERFLDLLRHFIVFEVDGDSIIKKMAGYHQFHAVNTAIARTVEAASPQGDRRVGVVWHTQGSGKSLTMAFYAGKMIQHPAMANPTLVILTDRNDLDDQLFSTFAACADLLRQNPVQAENREHLQELLSVASGGVVFTTIQKFSTENETYPQLSDRRNIVFIADEAHRSQYGLKARVVVKPAKQKDKGEIYPLKPQTSLLAAEASNTYQVEDTSCGAGILPAQNITKTSKMPIPYSEKMGTGKLPIPQQEDDIAYTSYGFAKYLRDALPNASFIGFTGTPIESTDKNTPAVFGDYIDIYDIQRAVEDGATVRIYYEGRLAKLELEESEKPTIDTQFEEITEGEELTAKEKLKSRWARLEALVGAEKRLALIAKDLVEHFERRQEIMDGKAMIVCMSRRICVDLYNAIVQLRPDWHHADDDKGAIKVVMTGSAADGAAWQQHIRNKPKRKELAKRFKDPNDPFKLVIVRDMWLTGFDAPCLHTMYVDKPMQGHGLMQAIARVNRVFKDKPGGLVVDYLGIADQLKQALAAYTEGDRGQTGIPQEAAIAIMQEKYEIVTNLFHGFDYSRFFNGTPAERLSVMPAAMNHILEQSDGQQRFVKAVADLAKAFALVVPHESALAIRDEVGFFQALKAAFAKHTVVGGKSQEDIDTAIRQIVSKAVVSDEVVDIFAAAGLKNPDISILSDEFLEEVRGIPHRNLALELLKKLLNDEIKTRSRKNLVQSRSFSQMLEQTIRRYQNRSIEAAQVIAELIDLAKDIRAAQKRGEDLGLTEDELAFYDALEVNDSAVQLLGDETLQAIARELVQTIRRNVTLDWTVRENVRAKLRTSVKRLLRKYDYPPDKQEKATITVLQQAELLCKDWVT